MSKTLIICEKPSLGRTVAKALGANSSKKGYLEGGDYLVTYCYGHLFSLQDIKDYKGVDKLSWNSIDLPFIPSPFKFKLKPDDTETKGSNNSVSDQFKLIRDLMNKPEVTTIVNCGDAEREGQVIVDLVYLNAKCKKPYKRLWLPDQTALTIQQAVKDLKDNSEYRNMFNEGLARTYIDWLLGINLTIHLTVQTGGTLYRTGRVLIPIVKYIYDRDMEIKNFVSEKYYLLESNANGVFLQLKTPKFKTLEEAKAYIEKNYKGKKAIVTDITSKDVTKNPPKLFSLDKAQAKVSKDYNINYETTLKTIQSLYEKGLVTYPRTNTEYLAENEKDKAKDIINFHKEAGVSFKDGKTIFDNSKIESHSAITPTAQKASGLTDLEEKVYKTIYNRFMAVFTKEPCIISQTNMTIKVGNDEFVLKGEVVKQEGWLKFESMTFNNKLPSLKKGDEFNPDFKAVEKQTTPPPKITEISLTNFLKNPFKKEDIDDVDDANYDDAQEYKDIMKGIEIGTQATRTIIIKNCVDNGYISISKKAFSIEEKGINLIQILDRLKINLYKEKSVEFSKELKEVFQGSKTVQDLVDATSKELQDIIKNKVDISDLGVVKAPSDKQLKFAKTLALRNNISLPEECKKSMKACSEFIDKYASNKGENGVSQKQIDFAKSVAEKSGKNLTDEVLNDPKKLSAFIDKHIVYSLSEKQLAILKNPRNKQPKKILDLCEKDNLTKAEYDTLKKALDKIFASWKKS